MKTRLGPLICNFLPFLYAINGCDTTSRLFGVAKRLLLKKIKTNADFKTAAETFCTKGKSTADIIALGEKALVPLYGGRAGDTLDMLRYKRFWEKAASSITTVQVRSLPLNSAAAKYHSLRLYLQVQDWIDKICDLKPEMWGWHLSSGRLDPCTTDLPPTPELLLKMIRCNC
ncbi:hypothetical protein ElyMa_005830700 [Elysia marginata]|uniref:Uncharacterized protein n=1 Tax=Elysia marginata TaxID=1093978 RepID=A0AAV4FZ66_9GAST|nr:hypothetical protein ElyMa_005830700 [Elysia marginata]